jgi:Family of unknown function (DUF6074)
VSAALIAFPIVRRCELIERIAEQMLARAPDLAEKHLATQIRRQASAMRRRQLDEDAIAAQMRAFEAAIRGALWRLVLTPPRPSGAA